MKQAHQGSEHSPKLPKHREHLVTSLRHRVCVLGGSVWNQELDFDPCGSLPTWDIL